MRALKSVKQRYTPTPVVSRLMEDFRLMTNDCIRVGLEFERTRGGGESGTPSMRKLSLLCYGQLRRYRGYAQYRLCAISKAAGILSTRRKSIRRGFRTKNPYVRRSFLASCYGFRVENWNLIIHLDAKRFEYIPLNSHTVGILSNPAVRVRSFTISKDSLSLCLSKEVDTAEVKSAIGIDRNLRNLTAGNDEQVVYYDMRAVVSIAENTKSVVRSFKRNDLRVEQEIASKYGRRRKERANHILHRVSRDVIARAKANHQVIVFEEIRGIRRLYRRGNGQSREFRGRMNSWPFGEIKRQVEYKAAWEGVPVITLTKGETKGTTMDCPRCGERLQSAVRDDRTHYRQLWCEVCKRWIDRDLAAVLNISRRGWLRFDHSSTEGGASEAVKGNLGHDREPAILRVDASKSGRRLELANI